MALKYTNERILQDLKFIFKTYGNLRNPSIVDSCKKYGTVTLRQYLATSQRLTMSL